MLYAKNFRKISADSLKGHWGEAIAVSLVAAFLGATNSSSFSSGLGSVLSGNSTSTVEPSVNWGDSAPSFFGSDEQFELFGGALEDFFTRFTSSEIGILILSIFSMLAVFIGILTLIRVIIGGAVALGYSKYNLALVDRSSASFSDLFSQFNRIGAGFCMQLLRSIYITLWSLLFIIPGIIKAYSYSMTQYIVAEHPEYGANDAITKSRELMNGNKWRLFCLDFSFIGWGILCVFTLGIGYLWLTPYIEASHAAFYREITFMRPEFAPAYPYNPSEQNSNGFEQGNGNASQQPFNQQQYNTQAPYNQFNNPTAQQFSFERIAQECRDDGLSGWSFPIMNVIYSPDGARRAVMLDPHNGAVLVSFEKLNVLRPEDQLRVAQNAHHGYWAPYRDDSIFDSPAQAEAAIIADPDFNL